jgi:hypothetical protein
LAPVSEIGPLGAVLTTDASARTAHTSLILMSSECSCTVSVAVLTSTEIFCGWNRAVSLRCNSAALRTDEGETHHLAGECEVGEVGGDVQIVVRRHHIRWEELRLDVGHPVLEPPGSAAGGKTRQGVMKLPLLARPNAFPCSTGQQAAQRLGPEAEQKGYGENGGEQGMNRGADGRERGIRLFESQ